MKRFAALIVLFVANLFTTASFAQSSADIASYIEAISESSISFDFNLTVQSEIPVTSKGSLLIQNNGLEVKTGVLRILTDWRSKWTVDNVDKEVIIEPVDMDGFSAESLLSSASFYKTQYKGRQCQALKFPIDPLGVGAVLYVSDKTPFAASFVASDGTVSDAAITNFRITPQTNFSFTLSEDSLSDDYVITDLR